MNGDCICCENVELTVLKTMLDHSSNFGQLFSVCTFGLLYMMNNMYQLCAALFQTFSVVC